MEVLAAIEDFLLAQATYHAARQRWPKERIRLSQQTRIVEDSSETRIEQRGAVAFAFVAAVTIIALAVTLWNWF